MGGTGPLTADVPAVADVPPPLPVVVVVVAAAAGVGDVDGPACEALAAVARGAQVELDGPAATTEGGVGAAVADFVAGVGSTEVAVGAVAVAAGWAVGLGAEASCLGGSDAGFGATSLDGSFCCS